MKHSFKIGSIILAETTARNVEGTTIKDRKENIILKDLNIEVEMSIEEMKESFSQFKEIINGIKEAYIFIKDEIKNGEIKNIKDAITDLNL